MKKLTSNEIRQIWIDFFTKKGHEFVEPKSLIPVNDPSLLWINSGVATLKPYFSGEKLPKNPRLTNSQKSIRTNDIENVGVTARHHTLFEMLGNFSIGDYFKEEAIEMAHELLFDVFKFEKDKIYMTYFSEDKETYDKWISLGIDPSHLILGNRDTNFWDMGLGPCGPDTEIFYDRGEKYDPENVGIKLLKEDLENDRYIEIWNVVFSQFNNDGNGNYVELKQKNIDTGAGLERITSIFQDAPTNFDTDLFLPLINEVESWTEFKYETENYFTNEPVQFEINKKFKIIADHIRAVVVAINDGAKPSNTQRGYIIRRLIRRSYRSGIQLNINETTFLYKLTKLVASMLPQFKIDVDKVAKIIEKEEIAFSKTIKQGEELLRKELESNKGNVDTKLVFKLFETYGFPVELTQEILDEKNIKIDFDEFEKLKEEHADASRGKKAKAMSNQIQVIQEITSKVSEFVGYEKLEVETEVIFQKEENGKWYVLLKETPFYSTKGGQIHDSGSISEVEVTDSFEDKYENHWHVLDEQLETTKVVASVDSEVRTQVARNHSATHLLGLSIKKVFGQSTQLGSDNNFKRLRLDVPLDKKPTEDEIKQVEQNVNELIKKANDREDFLLGYEDAIKKGTVALEGFDYGDKKLRVVKYGESMEFCGGTHVNNTKIVEQFKIVRVDSKGSGIFRFEAITSKKAVEAYEVNLVKTLTEELKTIIAKTKKIDSKYSLAIPVTSTELSKAIDKAKSDNKKKSKEAKSNVNIDTNVEFVEYEGMKAYINLSANPGVVKNMAITLREAHSDALIIVGAFVGKHMLAVASNKFNSKEIFDNIMSKFEGNGGGNEKFAMGSAKAKITL